jgi:hypothetical protein
MDGDIMPTISATCGAYGRRDVEFTDEELKEIDDRAYAEHNNIMVRCVDDAEIITDARFDAEQPTAIIAAALFAMRAKPLVYSREDAARAKYLAERRKPTPPPAQAHKQDTTNIS